MANKTKDYTMKIWKNEKYTKTDIDKAKEGLADKALQKLNLLPQDEQIKWLEAHGRLNPKSPESPKF